MRGTALEQAIEAVLGAGLVASGGLLAAGLLLGAPEALRWGILILLATPAARVVVVTAALLARRDWLFGLVSAWILAVLASSLSIALAGR